MNLWRKPDGAFYQFHIDADSGYFQVDAARFPALAPRSARIWMAGSKHLQKNQQ